METNKGTGWESHKRTHFDEIVVNYDKARPEYPAPLFADVIKYIASAKGIKALEIGAGTGKSTFPFLDAGYDVTAVEMGANMAEFLTERFKGYDNFNVINATFEDVLLEDNCYDLIYAASAFHWVDKEIGLPKVIRLLKSGGVLALR
jgi:ubiquinone/menaquinone biosynthesis C-methylase UbiE